MVPILVNCECGKQYQAKEENVGRRFLCTQCGRELTVTKPAFDPLEPMVAAPVGESRTSGKAITSLVLGIMSIFPFCTFFAGLPAIIFAALGLGDIGKGGGRIKGKGLAISGLVTGIIGSICIAPVTLALLLPAVQAAQEAARRAQCVNNLKQTALAFHNFEASNGTFPASSINDADGKPLLSWRVAILPYIGQEVLYKQFKLDEPWNSPTNQPLLERMPAVFRCPSDPAPDMTHYLAIIGDGTVFEGGTAHTLREVTDGTSNTIFVVEAKTPVYWTKPEEIDIDAINGKIGSSHPRIANTMFADGSVKPLRVTTSPAVVKALATRAGGEVISPDSY